MNIWFLIILMSGITFVALIFSARKISPQNSGDGEESDQGVLDDEVLKTEEHFKLQLDGIEADLKVGKLNEVDAENAKAELARELLHHRALLKNAVKTTEKPWTGFALVGTSVLTIGVAIGFYFMLGTPDDSILMRVGDLQQTQVETSEEFESALAQVEAQMLIDPEDVQGWRVLAPAYIRSGRIEDAVNAYRKILELAPLTPDTQTDLAEALLMLGQEQDIGEVMSLLNAAVSIDPAHARSRFYLAAESTRLADWDIAIGHWQALLDMGDGTEPWYATAQSGMAIAQARGETPQPLTPPPVTAQPPALSDPDQAALIRSMVAGLDERLNSEGGSVEEWTRLVRSYTVMGDTEAAQRNYDNAVAAYPQKETRQELDAIAAGAGLTVSNE
ncbi:MAG: c-type cytochrome biogenesis protein CcmI [Devosiaceae bacterium]|nr:c-type cytochrome biogenesis protein CcmI [Devosiaceae bacterium]